MVVPSKIYWNSIENLPTNGLCCPCANVGEGSLKIPVKYWRSSFEIKLKFYCNSPEMLLISIKTLSELYPNSIAIRNRRIIAITQTYPRPIWMFSGYPPKNRGCIRNTSDCETRMSIPLQYVEL